MEFSFNDIIYAKMDGNLMSSPLGPILSKLWCGFYENLLLKNAKSPTFIIAMLKMLFSFFNFIEEASLLTFKLTPPPASSVYYGGGMGFVFTVHGCSC